jgi:hypothetical protein
VFASLNLTGIGVFEYKFDVYRLRSIQKRGSYDSMHLKFANEEAAISLGLQFASLSFLFFDFDRQVVEPTMRLDH